MSITWRKDKVVQRLEYNWVSTAGSCTECRYAEVGSNGVTGILYHESNGPGDQHYVDIFEGKIRTRVFNLNRVVFAQIEATKPPGETI